jgi:hypothetical protein
MSLILQFLIPIQITFNINEINMNMHLLALIIASIFLQGCTYRGHQDFSVVTVDNVNTAKTRCYVKNAQGRWTTSPEKTIVVNPDEDPIYIRCENDKQWGAAQVYRSFENKELWSSYWTENGVPNLLQNFVRILSRDRLTCIFFCEVFDFVNDSQYKYPRYVYVGMNNK